MEKSKKKKVHKVHPSLMRISFLGYGYIDVRFHDSYYKDICQRIGSEVATYSIHCSEWSKESIVYKNHYILEEEDHTQRVLGRDSLGTRSCHT